MKYSKYLNSFTLGNNVLGECKVEAEIVEKDSEDLSDIKFIDSQQIQVEDIKSITLLKNVKVCICESESVYKLKYAFVKDNMLIDREGFKVPDLQGGWKPRSNAAVLEVINNKPTNSEDSQNPLGFLIKDRLPKD